MARHVTIATASYDPFYHEGVHYGTDREVRMRKAEDLIERAANSGAGIIAFPETAAQHGLTSDRLGAVERPDGFTVTRAAAAAARHGIWVIWPLFLERDGRTTNSAVLIDPKGRIACIYDKMHPTVCELDDGVAPGTSLGVFDTDFGRIGVCICYDLNFPDVMRGLGKACAEIIFFCSAYVGGLQMQFWAMNQSYYIASAILGQGGQVADISGHVLARVGHEILLVQQLNLDRRYIHMDFNEEKVTDILRKYGDRVQFEFFPDERRMTLSSEDPELRINQVMNEFGLERQRDYFIRSEARRRNTVGLPELTQEESNELP